MSDQPPGLKPTYGSGVRIAQIVHWLHQQPIGLSVPELARRLDIHERTLSRYINTLKESFVNDLGDPLIEIIRTGANRRIRFRRKKLEVQGSAYELMSLYMALDLMAFLDGTFIREGARDVLDRLQNMLLKTQGHSASVVMKDFHKKFFHWTEAPKDYSDHNETLEKLVNALIRQKTVRMVYQSPGKPKKIHVLCPLSILMYKRALYLVGRREIDANDDKKKRDLTFAVERIKKVTILDTPYNYPYDYDPERRFQSAFGLIQERDPIEIKLLFNRVVAANVASRRWHRTQTLKHLDSGDLEVTLRLEITSELTSWILSYGPFVRVLSPPDLKNKVVDSLRHSLTQYDAEQAEAAEPEQAEPTAPPPEETSAVGTEKPETAAHSNPEHPVAEVGNGNPNRESNKKDATAKSTNKSKKKKAKKPGSGKAGKKSKSNSDTKSPPTGKQKKKHKDT